MCSCNLPLQSIPHNSHLVSPTFSCTQGHRIYWLLYLLVNVSCDHLCINSSNPPPFFYLFYTIHKSWTFVRFIRGCGGEFGAEEIPSSLISTQTQKFANGLAIIITAPIVNFIPIYDYLTYQSPLSQFEDSDEPQLGPSATLPPSPTPPCDDRIVQRFLQILFRYELLMISQVKDDGSKNTSSRNRHLPPS